MRNKDAIILEKILDCQAAWDTMQQDLPELKTEVARILEQAEDGEHRGDARDGKEDP